MERKSGDRHFLYPLQAVVAILLVVGLVCFDQFYWSPKQDRAEAERAQAAARETRREMDWTCEVLAFYAVEGDNETLAAYVAKSAPEVAGSFSNSSGTVDWPGFFAHVQERFDSWDSSSVPLPAGCEGLRARVESGRMA